MGGVQILLTQSGECMTTRSIERLQAVTRLFLHDVRRTGGFGLLAVAHLHNLDDWRETNVEESGVEELQSRRRRQLKLENTTES